ncbi:four-carbon acid sugar kinase family protein [Marispirochaeta sp.]|jgi:D-threonate/D-erythronate kinase|uniref:four-carbon acid sugar kinase family protein n=1 Tax=Marispirochaeta sp. TaxID=2038653 RepID=UPI0029C6560E|nr:four-carbon acid sugar kinase family protein [Marispirochaeta sp.]
MDLKLCIIADDFTGAGDSAVQFRKNGYTPFLALQDWDSGVDLGLYNVLVVSTESRFMPPEESYSKVRSVVETCKMLGVQRYFKKIDSTIRGNIPEEIAAVMDAGGYECAIVSPAAPRNGRTVVGGNCLVHGVPVGKDKANSDPFTPVLSASVLELLKRTFHESVGYIDLTTVRSGDKAFLKRLQRLRQAGMKVIVADAETIEDLRIVASVKEDQSVLFVGASGLAEALTDSGEESTLELPRIESGKLLFVVGSVTETTRTQVAELQKSVELVSLCVSVQNMLDDEKQELSRLLLEYARSRQNIAVLITTFDGDGEYRKDIDYAAGLGIDEKKLGERVSKFLGKLVAEIFSQRHIEAVFTTGGDTAGGVSKSLEVKGVELLDELLPGIPIGKFDTPYAEQPVYLISKAGGFGKNNAMIQVCNIVTGVQ